VPRKKQSWQFLRPRNRLRRVIQEERQEQSMRDHILPSHGTTRDPPQNGLDIASSRVMEDQIELSFSGF
jgi:hypothetical protein